MPVELPLTKVEPLLDEREQVARLLCLAIRTGRGLNESLEFGLQQPAASTASATARRFREIIWTWDGGPLSSLGAPAQRQLREPTWPSAQGRPSISPHFGTHS